MMEHENRLYSYKMARATGFAPNPYFGVLTLATCKADLRRTVRLGDWIAGWTSKSLAGCRDEVGQERLVYLARVAKKLTYAEYWERYPEKRPAVEKPADCAYHGDNIYEPDKQQPGNFKLHRCSQHKDHIKKCRDLQGEYVLICEEFYYFGPKKPLGVSADVRPGVPKGQSRYGTLTEDASPFVGYVRKNAGKCAETGKK